MAFGLWKSRWEIHREAMAKSEERWIELRTEGRELREDYRHDVVEARLFNRELLIRLEKTYGTLGSTLEVLAERVLENTEEVKAQTQAILRLVDRFEEAGWPPRP